MQTQTIRVLDNAGLVDACNADRKVSDFVYRARIQSLLVTPEGRALLPKIEDQNRVTEAVRQLING